MYRRLIPLTALSLAVACSSDDSSSSSDTMATSVTVTASTTAGTVTATNSGSASATDSSTSAGSGMSDSQSGTDSTATTGSSVSDTATDSTTASSDSATTAVMETDSGGPACGNGIVEPGEVCDDGVNDNSYDGCSADCQALGPHCGDGMLYEGAELCDDGNDIDNDACSNACGADKCAEIMVVLEPLTPNFMMVLDKSGSMVLNKWDHDQDANTPDVTRWNSLYGVVSDILTGFQDKLNFGVTLFPSKAATNSYTQQACVVQANPEVAVAPNNKNPILAAIPAANSTQIYGGTPASSGMLTAINHLKSLDPKYPRGVLLVTDGAANCNPMAANNTARFEVYDQGLHTVVKDAWNNDTIPTYVVGIDISKANTGNAQDGNPDNIVPYDKLNELAVDGGKPQAGVDKFYATKNQIELQAALEKIAADALSCVVSLDEPPVFPQNTKVKVGVDLVPPVMDCMNEDGWVYVYPMDDMNMPPEAIELCGSWCQQLKDTGEINVEYYCKPG
ncbi:MAG: DUF4215 domain-containing protein [Myxococcales bacterium]|nr:DUF4215 domain-containing protein [Myxococcales bacterium]MCB9705671.1 DUF4215 domain-containing protein [Myxococcales bacterium]